MLNYISKMTMRYFHKAFMLILIFCTCTCAQVAVSSQVSFGTIADMRGQVGQNNTQAFLTGLAAVNDGNGGTYMWSDTATAADNGFTIIKVTSVTTGRWMRVSNGNTLKGSKTFSGTGLTTSFVVSYGATYPFIPSQIYVQARTSAGAQPSWITNITNTDFTVNFATIPILGTNNITIDYLVIKQ